MRVLTKPLLPVANDDSVPHDYSIHMREICLSSSLEEPTATSIIPVWSCRVQPSTLLRAGDNNSWAHHHTSQLCNFYLSISHDSSLATAEH